MIIGFPIWITWGCVYQSISEDNMKQLNVTWIWFWFNIEFDVAFTIGCLVSFRALYTDKGASAKRAKLRERQKQAVEYTPSEYTPSKPTVGGSKCSGLRVKTQALQNVLLTTFQEWEDTTSMDDEVLILPSKFAGIRTVYFDGWSGPYNSAHTGADSARTLEAKEPSREAHVC
ncbi:hypothetical protein FJTKL_00158 [Diaporthe vaccinii]|uniref:Integral membrane protein n=1 Tax=Diaporthe vaccinii TaxID=105482 RepID=A0ABR4E3Z1_9PEZI